jgi:hypothetical protein
VVEMANFNIFKIFPQLNNPVLITIVIGAIAIIIYMLMKRGEMKTSMKVFYFADVERLLRPLDVKELTIQNVVTKCEKYFWRRAKSWLWRYRGNTFVVFLAKVGKGITYRLETNPKDKEGKVQVEKLGSLYDGIVHCLQAYDEDGNVDHNLLSPITFTPETFDLLKKSEIFVCVDLEIDPSDVPLEFDEEGATDEADKAMAGLIGAEIKDSIFREDWIRNAGLMAIGATGLWVAQQLGLLP